MNQQDEAGGHQHAQGRTNTTTNIAGKYATHVGNCEEERRKVESTETYSAMGHVCYAKKNQIISNCLNVGKIHESACGQQTPSGLR